MKKKENLASHKANEQGAQFDKILKEISPKLISLLKDQLGIHGQFVQALPESIQYIKERKADFVLKFQSGEQSQIVHIEFQTRDDMSMNFRMAEYWLMLTRMYKLPVQQHVIYLGESPSRMPTKLFTDSGNFQFSYNLVSLRDLDHTIFLKSKDPAIQTLALLGKAAESSPEKIVDDIIGNAKKANKWENEHAKIIHYLRTIALLRSNSAQIDKIIMALSGTVLDYRKDIFFREGKLEGKVEGMVKTALLFFPSMTAKEIAEKLQLPEDRVNAIKEELEQRETLKQSEGEAEPKSKTLKRF